MRELMNDTSILYNTNMIADAQLLDFQFVAANWANVGAWIYSLELTTQEIRMCIEFLRSHSDIPDDALMNLSFSDEEESDQDEILERIAGAIGLRLFEESEQWGPTL